MIETRDSTEAWEILQRIKTICLSSATKPEAMSRIRVEYSEAQVSQYIIDRMRPFMDLPEETT